MRCTQIIGLHPKASDFLAQNTKTKDGNKCPNCGHVLNKVQDREVYDDAKDWGMFEDGPELYQYHLKDGTTVKEVVQACPWSSGPCIFLCLENEHGIWMFEWPQEEIDNA